MKKKTLTPRQEEILLWLNEQYGTEFKTPYRQIASDTEEVNHLSVRKIILALEEKKYITIKRKGTRRQRYVLHIDKLNNMND